MRDAELQAGEQIVAIVQRLPRLRSSAVREPSAASTDAALIAAGRSGDREALERLLGRHKEAVYVLCRGILGDVDDAEDALQETFLRALKALPQFRGEATFRTWLSRIAIHVCLRWRASRRPTVLLGEVREVGAERAADAVALEHLCVEEALGMLLAHRRAVFLLKERAGWSLDEIGAAFGWNRKRVQNELYKARLALAEWRRRVEGEERR